MKTIKTGLHNPVKRKKTLYFVELTIEFSFISLYIVPRNNMFII